MRVDLHAHSKYSPDSKVEPVELVKVARRLGLDGIAITDHNATEGARRAWEHSRSEGVVVIRGTEISTRAGHVLAYGVTEPIPRGEACAPTIEAVVAMGGVPVAAHPYRFWSGLGEAETLAGKFAAYEVQNARTLRRGNKRARQLAASRRVGATGGSDAHFPDEVGRALTIVEGSTEEDVIEALRRGRTTATGVDRGVRATARYVPKAVGEWILRGMRRV